MRDNAWKIGKVLFALKHWSVLEMHFGSNGVGLEVVMEVDSGGKLRQHLNKDHCNFSFFLCMI